MFDKLINNLIANSIVLKYESRWKAEYYVDTTKSIGFYLWILGYGIKLIRRITHQIIQSSEALLNDQFCHWYELRLTSFFEVWISEQQHPRYWEIKTLFICNKSKWMNHIHWFARACSSCWNRLTVTLIGKYYLDFSTTNLSCQRKLCRELS